LQNAPFFSQLNVFFFIFIVRHEAQECFCGEANCIGILGGKTQTDLGAMDDLYIDGLSPFLEPIPGLRDHH
jgi:hypothetical protein